MKKKPVNSTGTENAADQHPEPGSDPAQTPVAGNEKDYDELVHAENDLSPEVAKHDPDEAIHQAHKDIPVPGNEVDVDDILHSADTEGEDIR